MGRSPRVLGAGITYHAMARGNDRGRIFLQEPDWEAFVEILNRVTRRYSWRCHAYCLMPNHIHLAVTTEGPNLAHAMRDLLGSYARVFNRHHERIGHLFSSRYRTVVVEDDRQFLTLIRYISRNPVEASLVETPAQWVWSSYPTMLGQAPCPTFLDPHLTWAMFGGDPSQARLQLREFVEGAEPGVPFGDSSAPQPSESEPPRPTIAEVLVALGPRDGVGACLALGYRHSEIARELGIPRSAVSQRRRRLHQHETALAAGSDAERQAPVTSLA